MERSLPSHHECNFIEVYARKGLIFQLAMIGSTKSIA